MAVLPKYFLGSAAGTASSTTIPIATTNQADLGDLIVVRAACDNLSATTPTFTCVDLVGNTYTTVVQKAHNATAGAGAAVAIMVTKVTVALPAASTITVVLSAAVAAKAAYAETFTDCGVTVRASNSFSQSAAAQSGSGAVTPAVGDLVLGVAAVETLAAIVGDPDTVGGEWSVLRAQVASTGTTATSMTVAGQSKIPNVTASQTYGVSWTGVTDYAGAAVVLVPEVFIPPDPLDDDHVKIGDRIYCIPAHGVAVSIWVETPTQTVELTDRVVRATWQQGGAYDAGGSPWYNPTPNPCEIEVDTDDPRFDPTRLDAYDLKPLASFLHINLAEQATFGTWASARGFYGPLLAHVVQPQPGGRFKVQLSAADALTSLGDMLTSERPEEAPWQRCKWLAETGTKDITHNFAAGAGMDTPQLGRYHPDQGKTRLEVMADSALAAGQALLFAPLDLDEPLPAKTLLRPTPQGTLGVPGFAGGTSFLAAVDPELGIVPGTGDTGWQGANTRVACLTDIAIARHDAGFRTRIESTRTIAPWIIADEHAGPDRRAPRRTASLADRPFLGCPRGTGSSFSRRRPDDLVDSEPAADPATPRQPRRRTYPTKPVVQDITWAQQDQWQGTQVSHRFGYEVPAGMTGWFAMGRWIVVGQGTLNLPADYTETVSRLAGSGVRDPHHGRRPGNDLRGTGGDRVAVPDPVAIRPVGVEQPGPRLGHRPDLVPASVAGRHVARPPVARRAAVGGASAGWPQARVCVTSRPRRRRPRRRSPRGRSTFRRPSPRARSPSTSSAALFCLELYD